MNLYEMNQATRELYELLQNDEIDEQTFNDNIEAIGVDQKIESYCEVIKQMQADAEMLSAEIDRPEKRKKPLVNAVDRMKKVLTEHLNCRGESKVATERFTVRLTSSDKVGVVDETAIPKQYFRVKLEVDKGAIKDLLKNGVGVPGCELIKSTGVVIK